MKKEIEELKRKRNAVILAHNYQLPEVQDVADFLGDSLGLARAATETDADVIVFAGVSFMAEMAAVLNPDKIVLHPEPTARCPLADMLTREDMKRSREKYPGAPLVLYVNSPTELKAEADYVATSASAAKLISKLEEDTVLFGPDENLACYVSEVTGKHVVPVPRGGHCPVHKFLLCKYYVERAVRKWPGAKLLVHPEVPPDVRRMADFVGSTSQMLKAVGGLEGEEFIIGTEEGLVYRAKRMYPDKKVYPANPLAVCVDMKKITLLNIRQSLESMKPRVEVDPKIARRVREILEVSFSMV